MISPTFPDLSFNKIKRIEGLAALAKLTDLSLCHNELTSLEGLAGCGALECLSASHNRIANKMKAVVELRQLPALKVLALEGNPFKPLSPGGEADDYRAFCFAFLKLRYLDYQLVTQADVRAAREGGVPADLLAEFEDGDVVKAKAAVLSRGRAAALEALHVAQLDAVELLMEDLLGSDVELEKLRHVGGMAGAIEEFGAAGVAAAAVLRDAGQPIHQKIEAEAVSVRVSSDDIIAVADAALCATIKAWERAAKRARKGEPAEAGQPVLTADRLAGMAVEAGDAALSVELGAHGGVLVSDRAA